MYHEILKNTTHGKVCDLTYEMMHKSKINIFVSFVEGSQQEQGVSFQFSFNPPQVIVSE